MTVKLIKNLTPLPVAEPERFGEGALFEVTSDLCRGSIAILCQINSGVYRLIALPQGNRFADIIELGGYPTLAEINRSFGDDVRVRPLRTGESVMLYVE